MKWTKTVPSEPGWYWKRNEANRFHGTEKAPARNRRKGPVMMEVFTREGILTVRYASQAASTGKPVAWMSKSAWSGPIPTPEEQSDDSV